MRTVVASVLAGALAVFAGCGDGAEREAGSGLRITAKQGPPDGPPHDRLYLHASDPSNAANRISLRINRDTIGWLISDTAGIETVPPRVPPARRPQR